MATSKKSSRTSRKKNAPKKKAPAKKAAAKRAPKRAPKKAGKRVIAKKAAAAKPAARKAAAKKKPVAKKKPAPKKPALARQVARDAASSVTHEPRAFIEGKVTTDALAEEMGEDAVRAITTGEDEAGERDGESVAAAGGPYVVTNVFD